MARVATWGSQSLGQLPGRVVAWSSCGVDRAQGTHQTQLWVNYYVGMVRLKALADPVVALHCMGRYDLGHLSTSALCQVPPD